MGRGWTRSDRVRGVLFSLLPISYSLLPLFGEKVDLRVSRTPSAPKPMKPAEICRIRTRLHASQTVFARFLCVSPKAVQSWEQGLRRPQSSALRLLEIAKRNPQILLRG